MSEDGVNEPKIKVWGGVLFLFICMTIINMITKDSGSNDDSSSSGNGLAAILSIAPYVTLAKLYYLDSYKKAILLFVLLILQFIGGAYLARYYYWTSPEMSEVNRVMKALSLLKTKEKLPELTQQRDTISVLTESINTNPKNIEQGKKYIDVIDQLLPLHKKSYDSIKQIHEGILDSISSVKTAEDLKKVEKALRDNGHLNISALAAFRKQHDKCYEALKANLSARKEYYESFIKHESAQTQDYLLRKWSTLEDVYLKEESKLAQIQSEVKTQRNGAAQK